MSFAKLLRAWFQRLAGLFYKKQREAEFAAELESHLQLHIEDNLRSGMTPETARRDALMKLGGLEQTKENYRDRRGLPLLETAFQNLRFALRVLRKSSGFTAVTILTLGLGLGTCTAMFTVVRSVLLKPLPFRDPGRLIRLYEQSADGKFPYNTVAGGVFSAWKKQSHGFSELAIAGPDATEYGLSGTGGQLPEKVRGDECSWNLFPMLGVEPALGRSFTASDDQPSANGTVVLSWGLWKRRFGGDPAILNQTIRLEAKPYTVIGILDSQKLKRFADLDNEIITQVDFIAMNKLNRQSTGSAASQGFKEYTHLEPDMVFFIPYRTSINLGAELRSIAIDFN